MGKRTDLHRPESVTSARSIDLRQLQHSDLIRLGALAAEAVALAQEYDQSWSTAYCELAAACNAEMLARRHEARRGCGRALTQRAA